MEGIIVLNNKLKELRKSKKITQEELAEINRIKDTKFGTWDWNYGKSPEFNVQ